MARPGREEWPTGGGPAQPQADTLGLCYSDLTASFHPAASLPVTPGSQLCWPSGCLFHYSRGLQPLLATSLGFGNSSLDVHAKGTHPRETEVLEATAPRTKEPIVFGPDGPQSQHLSEWRGETEPLFL